MLCTCSARELLGESIEEKLDSLKATVATTFTAPGPSARGSLQRSKERGSDEGRKNSESNRRLLWEARGGDTTLVSE